MNVYWSIPPSYVTINPLIILLFQVGKIYQSRYKVTHNKSKAEGVTDKVREGVMEDIMLTYRDPENIQDLVEEEKAE